MSAIELAVRYSQKIEGFLEAEFGATGKGLTEKTRSVENKLPDALVRKIKRVAFIRNQVVHEDGYEVKDESEFSALCAAVVSELEAFNEKRKQSIEAEKQRAALRKVLRASQLKPSSEAIQRAASVVYAKARGHTDSDSGRFLSLKGRLFALFLLITLSVWLHSRLAEPNRAAKASMDAQGFDTLPTASLVEAAPAAPTDIVESRSGKDNTEQGLPRSRPRHQNNGRDGAPWEAVRQDPSQSRLLIQVKAGDGVWLKPNEFLEFKHVVLEKKHDSFSGASWHLKGTVINTSSVYLQSVEGKSLVYLHGNQTPIGPIKFDLFFDQRGLAPGAETRIDAKLGGSFGSYQLSVPDVAQARTLGVEARLTSISDGMGTTRSPYQPLPSSSLTSISKLARETPSVKHGNGFALQPNHIIAINHEALVKETGDFGNARWALRAKITNITSGYLQSVNTRATIYVPGHSSLVGTVKQMIYLDQNGLAPGASTNIDLKFGSFDDSHMLQVPDVVNAGTLGVDLRVTSATNGMGKTIR